MGSQTPSSGSAAPLAAFGFDEREMVAGGPLHVSFALENASSSPLYVAVGGERFAARPAGFEFRAHLRDRPLELGDPHADRAGWGGPVTVIELAPRERREQVLLVNQFLCLELLPDILGAGGEDVLDLDCTRTLSYAHSPAHALAPSRSTMTVTAAAAIGVRRDDVALDALVAALAHDALQAADPALRERAVEELGALRIAAARGALECVQGDRPRSGEPGARP